MCPGNVIQSSVGKADICVEISRFAIPFWIIAGILLLPANAQQIAIVEIPPAMTVVLNSETPDSAQEQPSSQQTQIQQTTSPEPDSSQSRVENFTGSINKGAFGYFLKAFDNTVYRLDDDNK